MAADIDEDLTVFDGVTAMTTNALIERKEKRDDEEPVADTAAEDEDSTTDEDKTLDEIIDTYAN